MLTYIKINGFKTFRNFEMYFSPFTVIAGSNASGKSNLFDALRFLSDFASEKTLSSILTKQRGELFEIFTLFDDNTRSDEMSFDVEFLVNPSVTDKWDQTANIVWTRLRYELVLRRLGVDGIEIVKEILYPIKKKDDWWAGYIPQETLNYWRPKSSTHKPFLSYKSFLDGRFELEVNDVEASFRRIISPSSKTFISKFNQVDTPHILAVCKEMCSWRFLQMNPLDLRQPSIHIKDKEFNIDIDETGKNLASTLMRLKKQDEYNLKIVSRLITKFLPEYIGIDVRLEQERLDVIYIKDCNQREYSSRILSEGTLRIIALCILAVDNHHSGLLCFEEPENGIHPQRLSSMSGLMEQLSSNFLETSFCLRQVIVNTHSPKFIEEVFMLRNPFVLVALSRKVTNIINENNRKIVLQSTRMVPVNETHIKNDDNSSAQELILNKRDIEKYLSKSLNQLLG